MLTEQLKNPWRAIVEGSDYRLSSQEWDDLLSEVDSLYAEAPIQSAQPDNEWPHGATVKIRWAGYGPYNANDGWAKRGPNGELVSAYSLMPLDPEKWAVVEERTPGQSAKASIQCAQPASEQKPVYQLRCKDGTWIDQSEQSYKYNLDNGHASSLRILYTAPPATPDKVAGLVEALESWMGIASNCSIESGCCCCGDNMKNHASPMCCGHSPVDMADSAVESAIKRTEAALAAMKEK